MPYIKSVLTPALKRFLSREITNETIYLEYGTGETTEIAVSQGAHVITVETDWLRFLDHLEKYETEIAANQIDVLYFNIGFLTEDGQPVNSNFPLMYKDYATTPWDHIQRNRLMPTMVMLNGLFIPESLACAFELSSQKTKLLINFEKYGGNAVEVKGNIGEMVFIDNFLALDYCPEENLAQQ